MLGVIECGGVGGMVVVVEEDSVEMVKVAFSVYGVVDCAF